MKQSTFSLFLDVLGVQSLLLPGLGRTETAKRFAQCKNLLEDFRHDLEGTISQLNTLGPKPSFIAEFSDSAYIVGPDFVSIAVVGLYMMRRALRHKYPLRGGIGVGTFSHESSGVRTGREEQIWSTSSFLGGSIVTAYQAERNAIPGLRVFIHPAVMKRNQEAFLKTYAIPLPEDEISEFASHELRFWTSEEVLVAIPKLEAFRDTQQLGDRPRRHYDAALVAYKRFAAVSRELTHALPALWLDRI